jgi:hypothetical protein
MDELINCDRCRLGTKPHSAIRIKRGSYHDVAPSPFAQDDSLDRQLMPLIPPPEAAFLLDPCASRVEGAAGQVIRMKQISACTHKSREVRHSMSALERFAD